MKNEKMANKKIAKKWPIKKCPIKRRKKPGAGAGPADQANLGCSNSPGREKI